MKFVNIVLALALIACAVYGEEEANKEAKPDAPSDAVELNSASYTKFVTESKLAVVLFYAPWCGHCKAFKPEFERIATALKEKGIPCGRIDGDAESEISESVGLEGFPTIFVYVDGKYVKYDGARSKDGVLAFVEKAGKPAYAIITEKGGVDLFLKENPTAVLGYVGNVETDGEEIQNMFIGAAQAMHFSGHAMFGMVSDPSFIDPEVKGPIFELHTPDLLKPSRFNIEGTEADAHMPLFNRFTHWISSQVMPVLGEINQDTYQGFVDARLPFVWFLVRDKDDAALLEKYSFVREIGRENIGKFSFVLIDGKSQLRQVSHLGFEMDQLPGLLITDRLRYIMTDEINADNLRKFLQDYTDGKIEPSLRSEEPPKPEDFEAASVKPIVSKTWKDVVMDDTRDVFVKFYAEWCTHCKALAPNFLKAADDLVSVRDKLYLAEINVPENELKEELPVEGFPTLIFFPAGAKDKFVVYTGDRSTGSLLKFIKEHKSFDWEMSEEANKDIAEYEAEEAKKKKPETIAEAVAAEEGEEEDEDPEVILKKLEEARQRATEKAGTKKPEEEKDEL